MRWAGHVTCMDGLRNVYRHLVGKPEGSCVTFHNIFYDGEFF
jgi:hypothetical protein